MEKVRDEVLETMLKDYKPLYRFLKQAEYEEKMKAYGTFKVPMNWFFNGEGEFGHFADTERVFCFNQLTYILLAESFVRGDIPAGAPTLTLEQAYKLQKESTLLVESNNIRYRETIISSTPFKGKLEIVDAFNKKNGEILFLDMHYDFEEGKATGENRVAILLRDMEKICKT